MPACGHAGYKEMVQNLHQDRSQEWELHPYVVENLKNWKQNLALPALLFDMTEMLFYSNSIFDLQKGD